MGYRVLLISDEKWEWIVDTNELVKADKNSEYDLKSKHFGKKDGEL